MRGCKGIKIFLAICPSSHRSKNFLSEPEVSWNLRLSHVSFLLSLFLLSWLPEQWVSCHFRRAGFSSRPTSTTGAFSELGFCCAWPPPQGGRAEVVSTSLNLRNSTVYVSGVCYFLSSTSPQQKFEAMDGPVLQLRDTAQFYLESKGKYNVKQTQKTQRKEAPNSILAPLFMCFFSSP